MSSPKRIKLDPAQSKSPILIPILPDKLTQDLPLVEVYVVKIKDPKTTSKVVVQLNAVLPIPELMHLKRIRGKGEVLLFPTTTHTEEEREHVAVFDILRNKNFDVSLLDADSVQKVKVAETAPLVRKQYDVVNKLWPCNFHKNPYWEKLTTNTVFLPEDLEIHVKFMRVAIEICKAARVKSSAVVVDPRTNSVVAFGYDKSTECPVKHATMVAVDNVAKTQKGEVWFESSDHQKVVSDQLIAKEIQDSFTDLQFLTSASDSSSVPDDLEKCDKIFDSNEDNGGPYLCTNYSVYLTREPCITCAMALIHSRAKRVFYGLKRPNTGALGSLCKIHCVENLNHHYEVFGGLLEDECSKLQ